MIDICKCNGLKCEAKERCKRYTIKPIPNYQSWADFYTQPKNKKGECGMFIPIPENKK